MQLRLHLKTGFLLFVWWTVVSWQSVLLPQLMLGKHFHLESFHFSCDIFPVFLWFLTKTTFYPEDSLHLEVSQEHSWLSALPDISAHSERIWNCGGQALSSCEDSGLEQIKYEAESTITVHGQKPPTFRKAERATIWPIWCPKPPPSSLLFILIYPLSSETIVNDLR